MLRTPLSWEILSFIYLGFDERHFSELAQIPKNFFPNVYLLFWYLFHLQLLHGSNLESYQCGEHADDYEGV